MHRENLILYEVQKCQIGYGRFWGENDFPIKN